MAPAHEAAIPNGVDDPFPSIATDLPWPDGRLSGGHLTWTGVAGLRLDLEGTTIAFDPFVTRPGLARVLFARARPDADLVRRTFPDLDAVFVGHTHYDHAMDLPAVAAASPRARIHGSRVTVELCRRLGIEAARLVEVEDGQPYEVGPFRVEAVASRHGKVPFLRFVDRIDVPRRGLPATPFRWPRGAVFAWRVSAGGRTFHVQDSAGIDDGALARQGPVDALIACLATRHGTPRYLARLGEALEPRVLVPFHHDDFFRGLDEPPRPITGLGWRTFLDDAAAMARRHDTRLWLPVRGVAAAW